jgi:hypothetical protein
MLTPLVPLVSPLVSSEIVKLITKLGLILMMGASMSACSDSWKEEVLLHDGQKIIISRSQSYGGQHEIGQPSPIKTHTISFSLPNSNNTITWTSEYGEEIGRTNFNLLAVHVLNGTPYIVASPNLCLSYNKWGRPNPPYVFFKYDNKDWRRIPLSEFPADFKTINVALDILGKEVEALNRMGFVSAEKITQLNAHIKIPEFRAILREPLSDQRAKELNQWCGEMVYDGKGRWIGIGWFRNKPSQEACLNYCEQEKVTPQYCPCANLFKGK